MNFLRHRSVLAVVIGAFFYGLLAFIIHLRFFPIGDLGVESDFYAELAVSAQRLVDGQFAVSNYPFKGPLYSTVLVALHFLTQPLGTDWYHCAVLLNAICATGTIVVLFSLMRGPFGVAVASAVTISTALCAEFFLHAQKASSDLLYLLLFLATVWSFMGWRNSWRLLVAGILAGLAFLTRYSGGVLFAGGLLVLFFHPPFGNFRRRLNMVALFGLGFLVVAAPWFALNLAATGSLLNDGNLMNIVLEFYPDQNGSSLPAGGFQSLGQIITHDPQYFFSHLLGNITGHFKQDMVQVIGTPGWSLVVLGLSGAILSFLPWPLAWRFIRKRRPNSEQGIFFGFAILSFLAMCLVFHRPRFSLPLVPAYFALGYGVILGFAPTGRLWVKGHRLTLLAATVAVLAVSIFQIQDIIRGERYYFSERPMAVLKQAPLIRALAEETGSSTLLARKPHLAHYAGLEPQAYPAQIHDWHQFFAFALKYEADLIVVGQQERDVPGETMILDHLDQARAVTRLDSPPGLTVYHLDRKAGPASAEADFPEIYSRIKLSTEQENDADLLLAQFDLGLALMPLAQWQAARASLDRCRQMYAADGGIMEVQDYDYLLVNLAYCHLKLNDYSGGLALLGENLSNLQPPGDVYLKGLRHFVLGQLLVKLQRAEEAGDHFRQAHLAYRKAGNKSAVAEVLMYLENLPQ